MIGSDGGLGRGHEVTGRCGVCVLGSGLKWGVRWGRGRLCWEVE